MYKNHKALITGFAVVLLALVVFATVQPGIVSAAAPEGRGGPGRRGPNGTGGWSTGGTALTPLTDAEKNALSEAVLEEYGALNLYNAVLKQYPNAVPFANIARSEQQHVNVLLRTAQKYGVTPPTNPGLANPPVFSTLAAACQAGVAAEKADAALYDELKPVTTHADIVRVYSNLQSASLNNHLPAFEVCD